mgnify:FL=1
MELEKMNDFFAKRIDGYETQMLENVEGCKEGYKKLAELIPDSCKKLLDLGCGTGLELHEIFKKIPDLEVTGIDLTKEMLDKLKSNFPDKNINLILGSYFDVPFGEKAFDIVISFQTMHHFTHESKVSLYKKIRKALKPSGMYIECDYVAKDQTEENNLFSELNRIRKEQNIKDDEFVHFDTPCTVDNQIEMFERAGFKEIAKVWQKGQTAIIVNKI